MITSRQALGKERQNSSDHYKASDRPLLLLSPRLPRVTVWQSVLPFLILICMNVIRPHHFISQNGCTQLHQASARHERSPISHMATTINIHSSTETVLLPIAPQYHTHLPVAVRTKSLSLCSLVKKVRIVEIILFFQFFGGGGSK